jgi:hypothetical protein
MSQRLITPSKVTAWLECPHYLTLESRAAAKLLTAERSHLGLRQAGHGQRPPA